MFFPDKFTSVKNFSALPEAFSGVRKNVVLNIKTGPTLLTVAGKQIFKNCNALSLNLEARQKKVDQ